MATPTKSERYISDTQLLAGLQKHFPSTTFNIQGGPQTTSQMEEVLLGRIAAAQAVLTAKAGFHSAVAASDLVEARSDAYVQDVRQSILMISTSSEVLSDCGVAPRKPRRPLTPEQKLIASAKAKATREARGTMGAKKKAAIKGTVPETLMVSTDGSGSGASEPAGTPPAAPSTTNGTTPHA